MKRCYRRLHYAFSSKHVVFEENHIWIPEMFSYSVAVYNKCSRTRCICSICPLMLGVVSVIFLVIVAVSVVMWWTVTFWLDAELEVSERDATVGWLKKRNPFYSGIDQPQVARKTPNWFVAVFEIIVIVDAFIETYIRFGLIVCCLSYDFCKQNMDNKIKTFRPITWVWSCIHHRTRESYRSSWKRSEFNGWGCDSK